MSNDEKSKLSLNIPILQPSPPPSGSHSAPTLPPAKVKNIHQPKIEMDLNILLKFIKPYDGERDKLNSFIVNCNNAYDLASETQKPILFKYILCQLQGKAEIACSIKNFANWEQLREFLKTQFSERKHYSHLLTDLQECKQCPQESVGEFALKVETALSKILTEISLSETKVKEVPGRVAAMEDLALHHFLMGLLPRLSNIVRCRSPKNLNEAINLAISEEKIQQCMFRRLPQNQLPNPKPKPTPNQNTGSGFQRFNQMTSNRVPQKPFANSYNPQPGPSSNPTNFCRYCKAQGHDISECRKREYNNNRFKVSQNSRPQPRINFVTDQGEDVVDSADTDISPPHADDDLNL